MEKELQKKLSFVLFVMAVFFAAMSLTVFQSHIWMSCIAGILLLAATVFYVLSQDKGTQSPTGKTSELLFADRMAELMRGNEKAEKGVYLAVKKQHEAMESGMAALEERIGELVKAQESAVKTLVMYNKENAKQMALSEREELSRVREELKQLQQGGGSAESMSPVVEAIKEMSRRLYEELHENFEAMLAELGTTVDSLEEMKELLQRREEAAPVMRVAASPVMTEPAVTAAFEVPAEEPEAPMAFEIPAEEPEVFPEPMAFEEPEEESAGPISDADIAALFAQTEEVSEPEEEEEEEFMPSTYKLPGEEEEAETEPMAFEAPIAEPVVTEVPVEEKKPEDAFASSGVDLSDPNKPLSADDIAALFASMGN